MSFYLPAPARHIEGLVGDSHHHRFIVGTCSLTTDNSLHILNYTEKNSTLDTLVSFKTPTPIQNVSASSLLPDIVSFSFGNFEYCKIVMHVK